MEQILQDRPPYGVRQEHSHYVGQLQAIHALRDELELSPVQYQKLLHKLTGSRSAKYMTEGDRERVISFFALHRDLSELVAKAQGALEQLNGSFSLAEPELMMDKEVYLNGDFLTRTQAPIESVVMMMRTRYGAEARLICASEEREVDETSLKLEFVA